MTGMPTSPPLTTSVESRPTTWPSCVANSDPPTLRIRRPAPSTTPLSSSGACCSRAAVSASAMLLATGSASSCQTGSVASTHWPRVIARGGEASSEISVASLSQSPASTNAWSRSVRWPEVTLRPSWFAMCSAWRFVRSHEMPPVPLPAKALCRCCMTVAIIAGSMSMPDSLEQLLGVEVAPGRAEQLTHQLLELLFGSPVVVCHFSRLSAADHRRHLR